MSYPTPSEYPIQFNQQRLLSQLFVAKSSIDHEVVGYRQLAADPEQGTLADIRHRHLPSADRNHALAACSGSPGVAASADRNRKELPLVTRSLEEEASTGILAVRCLGVDSRRVAGSWTELRSQSAANLEAASVHLDSYIDPYFKFKNYNILENLKQKI